MSHVSGQVLPSLYPPRCPLQLLLRNGWTVSQMVESISLLGVDTCAALLSLHCCHCGIVVTSTEVRSDLSERQSALVMTRDLGHDQRS